MNPDEKSCSMWMVRRRDDCRRRLLCCRGAFVSWLAGLASADFVSTVMPRGLRGTASGRLPASTGERKFRHPEDRLGLDVKRQPVGIVAEPQLADPRKLADDFVTFVMRRPRPLK